MKTAVVTGAASGIGYAVCSKLLKLGYHVIGIGRTQYSSNEAKLRLLRECPEGQIVFFFGDLMQQREVYRVADKVSAYIDENCGGRLDVLINNAGCVRSRYLETEDGIEQQFAINHLAGFLLTYRLFEQIRRCNGRIIITSSFAHEKARIKWHDIMHKNFYFIMSVYRQTKLCNVLFARELNRRYGETGIRAYAVNPGLVATDIGCKHTGIVARLVWSTCKARGVDPSVPAKTYAYLCETQPAPNGLYYNQCRPQPVSREVSDANSSRLFDISEQLCNIKYPK